MALFYVTAKKTLTRGFILEANNTNDVETMVRQYLFAHDDDDLEWEDSVVYELGELPLKFILAHV